MAIVEAFPNTRAHTDESGNYWRQTSEYLHWGEGVHEIHGHCTDHNGLTESTRHQMTLVCLPSAHGVGVGYTWVRPGKVWLCEAGAK